MGRSVTELLRQIHASQYTRKTGEVTPADWLAGGGSLKPGPELTGRVWQDWRP